MLGEGAVLQRKLLPGINRNAGSGQMRMRRTHLSAARMSAPWWGSARASDGLDFTLDVAHAPSFQHDHPTSLFQPPRNRREESDHSMILVPIRAIHD